MVLKIVHYNDPVLRQKGAQVTDFSASLTELADNMVETMVEAEGIGLAAPQVGQLIQLCVIDLSPAKRDFTWTFDGAKPPLDLIMPMALVNPSFAAVPGEDTVYEEGCLSFPEIRGDVVRPDMINVKFQDLEGGHHVMTCDGLLARCIQHEIDHLNGVLFIERMSKKVRKTIEPEIAALAKRTREAAAS